MGLRPWRCATLLIALGAAVPAEAAAEYYSWVGDDGVLHFTNVKSDPSQTIYKLVEGDGGDGYGGRALVGTIEGKPRALFPVDVTRFDQIFRRAAEHYNLPFEFLKAVAKVESNFNPKARSRADAKGLMQLMDATAAAMKVDDSFDPEQNIFGGTRYLRVLANMFDGDLTLTAAAYNAGPHRVKKAQGVPAIDETRRYVARVKKVYAHYRGRQ